MYKNWLPYFDVPDGSSGSAVIDKPSPSIKKEVADDDTSLIDTLIGDKDLVDLDELDKDDNKDDEDDDDEEDDLIEDKEDDDIIAEGEDTNIRAVDFKKIKDKYGDFAKTNDYKELRNAYYRESKYTELFGTIEEATEAAENNETYNKLNDSLVNQGEIAPLLAAVKEANPEAFKKVAVSFIDNLARLDNAAYVEAITPVVKRMARQLKSDGDKYLKRNPESIEGQALVATAKNIMHHFFEDAGELDKDEAPPDNRLSQKENELRNREAAIARDKWESAYSVADASVEKNLDKAILQGLDPDNKLNEFTRDALVEKIKNEVKNQIGKDNLHLKRMGSLWKQSASSGYSRESLSRIVSAYLERARPIIPTVRSKYRSSAIKSKSTDDVDDSPKIVSKGRSGRPAQNDGKVNIRAVDTKKIDYRNTTDDDIFEGKVKVR